MASDSGILCFLHLLGVGKDRSVVLPSMFLVFITFFYFFVIGSALHVGIYVFHHRVTYVKSFSNHIINLSADTFILISITIAWFCVSFRTDYLRYATSVFFSAFLVLLLNMPSVSLVGAALTLPIVGSLIIYDMFGKKKVLFQDEMLSMVYLTMGAVVLALLGIISILIYISTGVTTVTVEKYPYSIFQELLSILTPMLMAALVFCLPLKVILNQFFKKIKGHGPVVEIAKDKLSGKRVSICLLLCVILGVGLASVAHIPVVNPNNGRLGVDSPTYWDWINRMKNQTAEPAFFILKGDRPLTLVVLFLMTQATNADSFHVVEYTPLFFTPLLALVTFFLTRQLTESDKISIIASFLSTISFQTLIGIYSGFYANWLALILGYLVFGILVKYLKQPSKFNIVALMLGITGVLLAHTYTWTIIISVAFIFLFVLHLLNYYPKKRFLILYLVLSSSVAVDLLKSSWTGSSTGLKADISIGFSHGLGISQFRDRLGTLIDSVQTYYGGVYANIVILGLAMYWLIRCLPREPANIFLLIFMSTALVPLFIGDYVLQSRVLYEIPFQIIAAISLYNIAKKNGKIKFVALSLVTGYLSLHVITNLGFVSPILSVVG